MTKALTARQQQYQAIWALRQIGLLIGMYPPCKSLTPSPEELERRKDYVGREYLLHCLLVVLSDGCPPIARAALCGILDYAAWGWRDALPTSLLGYVVDRGSPQVRQWRKQVFARDGYKCRECGATDELHAHHIARWAEAPELRVEVDNGITLCKSCHEAEHRQDLGDRDG